MKASSIVIMFMLSACATKIPLVLESNESQSVENLLSYCRGETFSHDSDRGDYEGCYNVDRKRVALEGEFYFPETEAFESLIFPKGSMIQLNENDDRWLDEDLPDHIRMPLLDYSLERRQHLSKFHGKTVVIDAIARSNCATGHAYLKRRSNSNLNEIISLSGYCHSQADIYLSRPRIRLADDTDTSS